MDAHLYTDMCPCMHCETLHVACMDEPMITMIGHATISAHQAWHLAATISAPQAWPLAAAASLHGLCSDWHATVGQSSHDPTEPHTK
eukprot:1972487-Alexandrium_andersonii.AAC.1